METAIKLRKTEVSNNEDEILIMRKVVRCRAIRWKENRMEIRIEKRRKDEEKYVKETRTEKR